MASSTRTTEMEVVLLICADIFASVSVQVLTLYSFTCILASPGQPVSQKGDILFSKRDTWMLTEKRNYVWARRSHRVCVACSMSRCLCTPPAHMRRASVVHTRHQLGRRSACRARLAALCPAEDFHQQRRRYLRVSSTNPARARHPRCAQLDPLRGHGPPHGH